MRYFKKIMGFCFNRFLDIFSIHLFERILSNFLVKKGKLFSIRNLSTIPLSSCENHRFTQFLLPLYRCYNFYIGYNIYTIDSFSANASFVQLYVLQSYTRTTHKSASSATWQGTPVILVISRSKFFKRDVPPLITMPLSIMSDASSGGVCSNTDFTA